MRAERLIAFGAALLLYLATLPPGLTWAHYGGDGGELIAAAVTLGIPHPPGYPTWVMLGHVVARLPLGDLAWRFNLFSALCAAGAAVGVASVARPPQATDAAGRLGALAAALAFAAAPLVWSQAIITEVYALNWLLIALLLSAIAARRPAVLVGALWGLALTTHLTAALLLPIVVARTPRRQLTSLAAGLVVGLLPLLALPLLARGPSPIVWGDPTTPAGWWWLVSGALYRPNLFWFDALPQRLAAALPAALWQWAALGWLLLAAALWRPAGEPRLPARALLLSAALYAAYAVTYDASDAAVFAAPALLLLSILLADVPIRLRPLLWLLPVLLVALNFNSLTLRHERDVATALDAAMAALPADALVLTPGDASIFALWYAHYGALRRPDIVPVDANLLAFDWYRARLARHHPALRALARDDLPAFIAANAPRRPVCTVALQPFTLDCGALPP